MLIFDTLYYKIRSLYISPKEFIKPTTQKSVKYSVVRDLKRCFRGSPSAELRCDLQVLQLRKEEEELLMQFSRIIIVTSPCSKDVICFNFHNK